MTAAERPDAKPASDESALGARLAAMLHSAGELVRALPGPLARLRVSSGKTVVELEWAARVTAPAAETMAVPQQDAAADPDAADDGLAMVTAPLVGTFYHAPEPGAPPFVSVGDVVEPGQTVGIIEAMKLMNPIVAEHGGRVMEVLVPNATAVEFDQPLIGLVSSHDG